jgi:hypothetical protein
MKPIVYTTALLISTLLNANDPENGKELFDEAKCMGCHNKGDFKYNQKKVKNMKILHQKVDACAINNGAGWFDDETLDVVHYLNKEYYKFKDTKK